MGKSKEDHFKGPVESRTWRLCRRAWACLQGTGGGVNLAWEEPNLLRSSGRKPMQYYRSPKGTLGTTGQHPLSATDSEEGRSWLCGEDVERERAGRSMTRF